jgi:membrane protein DedA with SNARE-associated domain
MLERLVHGLLSGLLALGYPGIVALMAMESSVLPVPAELVMPPAGYWVAKGEMDFTLAVASGVVGSVLGALVNYALAWWLGRGFVRRFGKYVLVSEGSLARAERYFARHGDISVLIGRMLPVVRHLISIPAGLARMPLPRFIGYTGLGALVWCSVLTLIGYVLGRQEGALRQEDVSRQVSRALLIVIPILLLATAVYVWRQRRRPTGE